MADGEMSIRYELRAFLKAQITDQDEFDSAVVLNTAVDRFMSSPEFIATYITRMLRALAKDELSRLVAASRGTFIELGNAVVTKQGLAKRASDKFLTWMEHAGGTRMVTLMEMSKSDLLIAAKERENQGNTQLDRAAFLRELAARLNDSQRVRDQFTTKGIEEVQRLVLERRGRLGDGGAAQPI